MKVFFRSVYLRVSLLFFITLFSVGVTLQLLNHRAENERALELQQKLHINIATALASQLRDALGENRTPAEVRSLLDTFEILNPLAKVYLLDASGNVMRGFDDRSHQQMQSVDVTKLDRFIDGVGIDSLPISAEEPTKPGAERPFSAERIIVNDNPGYLYVTLGSDAYHRLLLDTENHFTQHALVRAILVCLVASIILGLTLYLFLSERFNKMRSALGKLSRGDLSARLDLKGRDELGELGERFNEMATVLADNIEVLKSSEKHQREAFSNISHDLRSPLTAIRGFLEILITKSDKIPPAERLHRLKTIHANIIWLEKLVNELFEYAKLNTNQVKPRPEPFLIKEFLYDIRQKFEMKADEKGIAIELEVGDRLPLVAGDIMMLERAVSNLIDNALTYTPEGGKIVVSAFEYNGGVQLKVEDNGIGISAEDVEQIFDRFYRADKARSGHTKGAGLGLAIVKKIIEAHNSQIRVASKLDVGTSFEFELRAA